MLIIKKCSCKDLDPDAVHLWSTRVAENNITLSVRYLNLLKENGDVGFFYVGYLENKIAFIAFISIIKIKLLVTFPVILFGGTKTNGKAFWFDERYLDYENFVKAIKKKFKADFIIIRDFSGEKDKCLLLKNSQIGLLNHHALTNNYLPLGDFNTIDEYLKSLTSKKRNYLKGVLKTREKENLVIKLQELGPEIVDEIYPLYFQTNLNAKENKTKASSINFFKSIIYSSINSQVVTIEHDNKMIAFGLMLYDESNLKCLHTGFDYKYAKQYDLWYQVVYESIKYSIEMNCVFLDMGSSSSTMKSKFQVIHEDVYMSVLYKNKFLTYLLRPLITYCLKLFLKPI